MLDYESAKKLTVLGFLVSVGLEGLLFCVELLGFFGLNLYTVSRILYMVNYLALVGIAGAFGLKFLCKNNMPDLLLGGSIGLAGLFFLYSEFFGGFGGTILYLIIMAVCSMYYLVFAFLIKDKNPMLFLLLCCAFLFSTFSTQVFFWMYQFLNWNVMGILWMIKQFGYVVCAGLCFLTCREDWE